MSNLVICQEIRTAKNGFIVELRWPYGDTPGDYGEVVCQTWQEVLGILTTACPEELRKGGKEEEK